MIIGFTTDELKSRMKAVRRDFVRKWSGRRGSGLRNRRRNEQSELCALGRKALPSLDVVTQLDHIVSVLTYAEMPISIEQACALANTEENFQLVCERCGKRKSAIDLEENPMTFDCDEPPSQEEMKAYRERKREWSRNGGRKNAETPGRMAAIGRIGGRVGGRIGGRKNADIPGRMAAMARIGGRKAVTSGHLASLRTPEHQAQAGRIANHLRWHVTRGLKNPKCALCQMSASG